MSPLLLIQARIIPRRINLTSGIYCCGLVRATIFGHCTTPTSGVLNSCRHSQVKASCKQSLKCVTPTGSLANTLNVRYMSSQNEKKQSFWQSITQLDRVKQTLRDYGVVASVFHISMSLCVLGGMYMLVDK